MATLHNLIRNLVKRINRTQFCTEVQIGKTLAAGKEVGVRAGQHSHNKGRSGEKEALEILHPSRRRRGEQEPNGRAGKDSFPQLCDRELREWIQSFPCVLSWVLPGMWTVNLSSSSSLTCKQPLFLPSASRPPAFQSFFIYITLSILLPPFVSTFSWYLSSIHLNISVWSHFALMRRPRKR